MDAAVTLLAAYWTVALCAFPVVQTLPVLPDVVLSVVMFDRIRAILLI